MRFLADENCDFAIIETLRDAGHEVETVTEIAPGADDDFVLRLALRNAAILLTEDKDFGQLVYANSRESGGVMLLRFPARARDSLCRDLLEFVRTYGDRLLGRFVVVQPGRIRISHSLSR